MTIDDTIAKLMPLLISRVTFALNFKVDKGYSLSKKKKEKEKAKSVVKSEELKYDSEARGLI